MIWWWLSEGDSSVPAQTSLGGLLRRPGQSGIVIIELASHFITLHKSTLNNYLCC